MMPSEFRRKRDRIEGECIRRSKGWRKRALAQLVKEARGEVLLSNHKAIGHRLGGGHIVCVKQRYTTEAGAVNAINEIAREPDGRQKPIRAFSCHRCGGWHLTKQPKYTHDDAQ